MTSPLSDDERALLARRIDDFRNERFRGPLADWGPFLTGLNAGLRREALVALIANDLQVRWEGGERPLVEEYVVRFSELGPIDRFPAQLIVEEFRCRRTTGDAYDPAHYRKRFPVQFPEIQGQLETAAAASSTQGPPRWRKPSSVLRPAERRPRNRLPSPPRWCRVRRKRPGRCFSRCGHRSVPDRRRSSIADEYEYIRLLGRGVFGEVWLAKKRTSGIEKAIKVLMQPVEKDAGQRELRSLELIKNQRHPYLLSTEDFWVIDQRLHIVMELAECTLRNRLESCRAAGYPGIPEIELLGYIREAADGLDFLHSRHIVHRDVKPDNILILNGHAKVADFGLAWQQDQLQAPMKTFAGTPAYMAPEVWGKEGGPASDQYSLAVTYIEMRQGRPPFQGRQIEEMMSAHLDGAHAFEPFVQEEEREALTRALARCPEDRYPTCSAFIEELSLVMGVSRPGSGTRTYSGIVAATRRSQTAVETRADLKSNETILKTQAPTIAQALPPTRKKTKVAILAAVGIVAAAGGIWAAFGRGNGSTNGAASAGDGTSTKPATLADLQPGQTTDPQPGKTNELANQPILPARAHPDPSARIEGLVDRRRVYDWIVIPVAGEDVRFRLISGGQPPRPIAPFYMMESKVWNNLFRAGKALVPVASEQNGPDAPVTSVTVEEAANFARDVLGGKLPAPDEWDLAAGLYSERTRDEITRADGRPRVLLAKPEPTHGINVGTDLNRVGLRDMAGNGREWTRKLLMEKGERDIGDAPLVASDRVILRGRSYTFSRGLTFSILDYEQTNPQTQFATARSPYTSFRVVIPLK